jgi:hypothetical protein
VGQGGGLFASGGTLQVVDTSIDTNTARGGAGGAGATSTVNFTPIRAGFGGNGGAAQGGGLYLTGGTVSFANGMLSANEALGGAGNNAPKVSTPHSFNFGGGGGDGGTAQGGGVFATNVGLTLANLPISANNAIGGNGGSGTNNGSGRPPKTGYQGSGGFGGDGGAGLGGGLYSSKGTLSLTDVSISANQATGGQASPGLSGIAGATYGLGGGGGDGGAGQGGGFYSVGGTVSLTIVTLSANQATGAAGATSGNAGSGLNGPNGQNGGGLPTAPLSSGHGGTGGAGQGGGLYSQTATLSLTNVTVTANTATSGAGGAGGNGGHGGDATGSGGHGGNGGHGSPGGDAGAAGGGGVYATGGTLSFTFVTVAANQTQGAAGGAAGSGGSGGTGSTSGQAGANGSAGKSQTGLGGGVQVAGATVNAVNSLFATNTADSNPDFSGNFSTASHNLLGDGTGSNLAAANPDGNGNFVGSSSQPINPLLGTLGDYGGFTQTIDLLPGSPAIDAGTTGSNIPTTDQRGVDRTTNANPDIGAFEFTSVQGYQAPDGSLHVGNSGPSAQIVEGPAPVAPGEPVMIQILDNGSVVGTFAAADVRSIYIDAGPGSNSVTVTTPPNPCFVTDSTGTTALVVDDSADATARTLTVTGTTLTGLAGLISYVPDPGNGVSSLTFDPGSGGTTIDVLTTSVPTAIHSQGNDTVVVSNNGSVQGIQANLSIDNAGGSTAVTVDDSADMTARTATLTASALTGLAPAAIGYGPGVSSLTVNGGSGGNSFAVQGTAALSGGTTLNAGAGGDTISVGSAANTLDPLLGPLAVNGQGGNTTLNYNDQGATQANNYQYTVSAASLERQQVFFSSSGTTLGPPVAPVSYAGISTLNVSAHNAGSAGDNFLGVAGSAPGCTTSVYGETGYNEFLVEDSNDSLNSVHGPLFLHGSGSGSPNNNTVLMGDLVESSRQRFLLTAGSSSEAGMLQRFDPVSGQADMAPISYDGINSYAVLSTANSEFPSAATAATVNLQSEAANLGTIIVAGTGDSVTVGNGAHTMAGILGDIRIQAGTGQKPAVLLDDSGDSTGRSIDMSSLVGFGYQLTGLLPASSLGRGRVWLQLDPAAPVTLRTGAGNDIFRIHDLTNVPALALDGGGGTNTLDYSAYVGNVLVDLPVGAATGLSGGISHIENVTGSQGNDLLVGDANANELVGGTGRNVLIGGAGPDTLDASRSTGDNLPIGGSTNWDTNLAALQAIMAEWDRTDLGFMDRHSDLLTGTNGQGKPPLNQVNGQLILLTPATNPKSTNGTVHGDASPDTLIGGAGQNWFFYDGDDILNPKKGDKTNKVR